MKTKNDNRLSLTLLCEEWIEVEIDEKIPRRCLWWFGTIFRFIFLSLMLFRKQEIRYEININNNGYKIFFLFLFVNRERVKRIQCCVCVPFILYGTKWIFLHFQTFIGIKLVVNSLGESIFNICIADSIFFFMFNLKWKTIINFTSHANLQFNFVFTRSSCYVHLCATGAHKIRKKTSRKNVRK